MKIKQIVCFFLYISIASPRTELTKECNDIKSDETDKSKVYNGSDDTKMEDTKLSNEQNSVIVENGTSESNDEVKQDVSVDSNAKEIKDTDDTNEVKENETKQCNLNDGHLALDVGLEHKPVRIDDSVILEQTSKKGIRQKVWAFMEENSLVIFPKPCFNRIPNFKGCNNVSLLLEKLDEFKKAKTVQVTPDKAQETARFLTLNVRSYFMSFYVKKNINYNFLTSFCCYFKYKIIQLYLHFLVG